MMFLKKTKKPKDTNEKSQTYKDFKRPPIEAKEEIQQDFNFYEKGYNKKEKEELGTKQGLRLEVEKISSDQVEILKECKYENTALALMKILGRSNRTKFKQSILTPLVKYGFFELTIPEKPKSPKQKYRLTGQFVQKKVEK